MNNQPMEAPELQLLGNAWQRCKSIYLTEEMISVRCDQGDHLILMEVWGNPLTREITHKPAFRQQLAEYTGGGNAGQ